MSVTSMCYIDEYLFEKIKMIFMVMQNSHAENEGCRQLHLSMEIPTNCEGMKLLTMVV
jgi:hypothetical protein